MQIRIQSIHFDADDKLLLQIEKKVSKLDHFFDRITNAEVFLRLDNGSHQVKDKIVELKLNLPGTTLFAKESQKSFESSLDVAVDTMKRQLSKHKEKIRG